MTDPERLTLVAPHAGLEASYRSFVREFVDRGEPLVPFTLALPHHHFPALLATLAAAARGEGLPAGFVPHSTFWLVRNGTDIVGISNLRHRLTASLRVEGGHIGYGVRPTARGRGYGTTMLRLTLDEARAIGIHTALVTCLRHNVASAQIIRHNGGQLASEEFLETHGDLIQRYTIAIGPGAEPARP